MVVFLFFSLFLFLFLFFLLLLSFLLSPYLEQRTSQQQHWTSKVTVNAFIFWDPLKSGWSFVVAHGPHFWGPPSNGMASQGQKLAAKLPQLSSSRKMGAPNAFKRQVRHVRSISRLEVLPGRCPVPIADFTVNVTVPQMPQFDHQMREVKGTLWLCDFFATFKTSNAIYKMSQTTCQDKCDYSFVWIIGLGPFFCGMEVTRWDLARRF